MKMTVIESNKANKGNLLLIGDLLVDKTWPVRASKLSPEGPIPVAQLSTSEAIETPGGAGLAASFGVKNFNDINLYFYTATSSDRMRWLNRKGINADGTLIEPHKVIYKTRFIDESSRYHMLRVDNDDLAGTSRLNRDKFAYDFRKYIRSGLNGVVLLDYCKGIFSDDIYLRVLIDESRERNIPVYVDSRSKDLHKFAGVDFLKLNAKEYKIACQTFNCNSQFQLIQKLKIKTLLITKGEEGAELWGNQEFDGYTYRAPLDPHPGAPDVTGCGDAFDVSFCYYKMVERLSSREAFEKAIEMATTYAHMPIEERLC